MMQCVWPQDSREGRPRLGRQAVPHLVLSPRLSGQSQGLGEGGGERVELVGEKVEKAPKTLDCLSLIEKSRPGSFPSVHLILETAQGVLTGNENPEAPLSLIAILRLVFRQGQGPQLVWA